MEIRPHYNTIGDGAPAFNASKTRMLAASPIVQSIKLGDIVSMRLSEQCSVSNNNGLLELITTGDEGSFAPQYPHLTQRALKAELN